MTASTMSETADTQPPAIFQAVRDPDADDADYAPEKKSSQPPTPMVPESMAPIGNSGKDADGGAEAVQTPDGSPAAVPTNKSTLSVASMTREDLQARRDAALSKQSNHRAGKSLDLGRMTAAAPPPSAFSQPVERPNRSSFSIDISRALDSIGTNKALRAIATTTNSNSNNNSNHSAGGIKPTPSPIRRHLPVPPRTPTKVSAPAPPLRAATPPSKPALLSPGTTMYRPQPSPAGKLMPDVNVAALDDDTTVFFIDDNFIFPADGDDDERTPITPVRELETPERNDDQEEENNGDHGHEHGGLLSLQRKGGIANSARVSAVGGIAPGFPNEFKQGSRDASFSAVGGQSAGASLADVAAGNGERDNDRDGDSNRDGNRYMNEAGGYLEVPSPVENFLSPGSPDGAGTSSSITEDARTPPDTPGGPRINAADAPKTATSLAASADGLGLGYINGLQRISPISKKREEKRNPNGPRQIPSLGAVGGSRILAHLQTAADTKKGAEKADWNASLTAIHGGSEGKPAHWSASNSEPRRVPSIESLNDPGSPGRASITSSMPPTPVTSFGMLNPHDTVHGLDPAASTASITAIRSGTEGGQSLLSPLARVEGGSAASSPLSTPRYASSTRPPESPLASRTPVLDSSIMSRDTDTDADADEQLAEHVTEPEAREPEVASHVPEVLPSEPAPEYTEKPQTMPGTHWHDEPTPQLVQSSAQLDDQPPPTPAKDNAPSIHTAPSSKESLPGTAAGAAAGAGAAATITAAVVSTGATPSKTSTSSEASALNTPETETAPLVPHKDTIRIPFPASDEGHLASNMDKALPVPRTPKRIPVPKLAASDLAEEREKAPSKPSSVPSSGKSSKSPSLEDHAPGPRDQAVGAPATRTLPEASREPQTYPAAQLDASAEERVGLRAGDMEDPAPAPATATAREKRMGMGHIRAVPSITEPATMRLVPARQNTETSMEMINVDKTHTTLSEGDKDDSVRKDPTANTSTIRNISSMYERRPSPEIEISTWRPEPGYQGVSGMGIENRPVRTRSRSGSAMGFARAVVSSTTGGAKKAGSAISNGVRSVSGGSAHASSHGLAMSKSKSKESDPHDLTTPTTSTPTSAIGLGDLPPGIREAHQAHQRNVSSASTVSRRRKLGLLTKLKSEIKVLGKRNKEDPAKIA